MDIRSTSRAVTQLTLGLLPWVPTKGPRRASDVTARWLTDKVGSRAPGAVALGVEPLDGTTGTTDRQRLAVTWNEAGVEAGLPSSVFIKSTPLSAKNRTMVASLDMAVNEVDFYRHVGEDLGDLAPKAYFTYAGVGARHLLVLEDLVARGCQPHAVADDCGIDHARSVIGTLAQLHAAYWEDQRLGTQFRWARTWSKRPGHSCSPPSTSVVAKEPWRWTDQRSPRRYAGSPRPWTVTPTPTTASSRPGRSPSSR